MATLIQDIFLGKVKNAQHDEFMGDVLKNANLCSAVGTYLPTQLSAFRAAVEAEHAMISRPLRWETTPQITEGDSERDRALAGLRYALWASVRNPDPDVRSAAEVVLRMSEIDKVSGSEQYDEETGKITEMLTTILGQYLEQTEAAMVKPYAMALKQANDKFCRLLQERDQEQGTAGPRDTETLRQATDQAYRKLILDINSVAECIDLGIVRDAENQPYAANPFAALIDYMNGLIDRYRREIINRKGSDGSGSSEGSATEETEETEETVTEGTTGGSATLTPDE